MNEFIVWDSEKKEFDYNFVYGKNILINDFFARFKLWRQYSIHQFIGKTDINGEKIFSESSVVEFVKHDKKNGECISNKLCGIFTYCEETLRYKIELLDNNIYICLFLNYDYQISDLKIIDTIQQNKLGLIKDNK